MFSRLRAHIRPPSGSLVGCRWLVCSGGLGPWSPVYWHLQHLSRLTNSGLSFRLRYKQALH